MLVTPGFSSKKFLTPFLFIAGVEFGYLVKNSKGFFGSTPKTGLAQYNIKLDYSATFVGWLA